MNPGSRVDELLAQYGQLSVTHPRREALGRTIEALNRQRFVDSLIGTLNPQGREPAMARPTEGSLMLTGCRTLIFTNGQWVDKKECDAMEHFDSDRNRRTNIMPEDDQWPETAGPEPQTLLRRALDAIFEFTGSMTGGLILIMLVASLIATKR